MFQSTSMVGMPWLNESGEAGEASQWNFTKTIQTTLEDIEIDANFAWLLFSLLVAMIWFTYITHYSARVTGQILTRILNRFVLGSGYLRIGSLTWDALAGKIMFRDIVYTTEDYSIRVQDGWLVFRWWRAYVPRDISEDLSHSDTRLSLLLNGLEIHIYNRSGLYSELERLFGLDRLLIPEDKEDDDDDHHHHPPGFQNLSTATSSPSKTAAAAAERDDQQSNWGARILGRAWRDLIPVIKVEICSGRAVFGNRLVPTTLCLSMEEGHMVYSTKPAVSKLDHFMHVVNCRAENFKVTLATSLKYTGLSDEPPRLMGEGFVVVSSNTIDFYYYMDEPGLVPEVPLMMELANGDVVECHPPIWGLDIRCGKGTDFSYGPWADRKREQLFKFFYPQAYQPLEVTSTPRPGERRAVQSFDIRVSTLAEATVDILFSKCKETNAVHMTVGAGSYLEITIPWTVRPDGCSTRISGQLLHVDASTSLQYRSLLEAETLEISVVMEYPLTWNSHQNWRLGLTGTKATLHLIYEHRYFFQDMINDWSSRSPVDLLFHVPYTWRLNFCLKEFELVTLANQYNWVDCSSQHQENAYAAFSGDFLQLAFDLPFTEFLPPTVDLKFRIQGEALDMNIQLPEMSTNRPVLLALSSHAKTANRLHNGVQDEPARIAAVDKQRWRNLVKRGWSADAGWVQCCTVPILSLTISYTYHPMSAAGPTPQANVSTPEREELLLNPVRFPTATPSSSLRVPVGGPTGTEAGHIHFASTPTVPTAEMFDVTTLSPDLVNVELELGPSELYVYGTLLRIFLHLKENIFGEDQRMADMDPTTAQLLADSSASQQQLLNRSTDPIPGSNEPSAPANSAADEQGTVVDVRIGRPLHVDVSITLHDIHAHLMKHCNADDPPCPTVSLERLSFEMHKTFLETQLQLVLSPAVLYSTDGLSRAPESQHLQEGFAVLSALQVRGHAMFSPAGRAINEETLEYAWLIEAILGQLTGRLTLPQLQHITAGLEAFLHLALDDENQLTRPSQSQTACHHGVAVQGLCPLSTGTAESHLQHSGPSPLASLGSLCPSAEEIKYRMTRLSVDSIDLAVVETGTAVSLQAYPIRLATCNLHSHQTHTGVSVLVPHVQLRQYLATTTSSPIRPGGGLVPMDDSASSTAAGIPGRTNKSSRHVRMSSSTSTWTHNRTPSSADDLYLNQLPGRSSSPAGSDPVKKYDNGLMLTCQEWLEVGLLELGPIYIDVGSSTDHSRVDLPTLQSAFLRLHDNRTKRLWFLGWDRPEGLEHVPVKSCGCRGGCAFFGHNAHGRLFFQPDAEETNDTKPNEGDFAALANPQLRRNATDLAFAQSLLRGGRGEGEGEEEPIYLIDFDWAVETKSSVGDVGLLGSELAVTVANGGRCVSSEAVSNSSTIKNVDMSHTEEDPLGEASSSPSQRSDLPVAGTHQSSRLSLQEACFPLTDASQPTVGGAELSSGGTLKRLRSVAAASTSALPSSHSAPERQRRSRVALQGSMPALVDSTDGGNLDGSFTAPSSRKDSVISASRISRASRTSGSRSELYFSAEEDDGGGRELSSSSDELVSLSSSPKLPKSVPARKESKSSLSDSRSSVSSGKRNSARTSHLSSSFNSAVSSADDEDENDDGIDDDEADDFSLVDLHLQSARPVVDSPILLTSYITHLSRAECSDWAQPSPKFPSDIRGHPWSARSRFVLVKSGFSSFRLVDRPSATPAHQKDNTQTSFGFFYPKTDPDKTATSQNQWNESEGDENDGDGSFGGSGATAGATRSDATTVLVKVGRPVHLMVCPLTLESAQRLAESLVPTLERLQPLTLLTRLRRRCIGHVESQNPLKKQRTALLEQRVAPLTPGKDMGFAVTPTPQNLFGDPVFYQLRGSIQIPRVNLCLLQAGIVEQIISLSALDNPRDLVCVSSAAVCVDGLSLHFSQSLRQCRMVQAVSHRPAESQTLHHQSTNKSFNSPFGNSKAKSRTGQATGATEVVYVEWTQTESEQLMLSGTLGKIHLQLRRLNNDTSLGGPTDHNLTATVIPPGCSRVLFNFCDPSLNHTGDSGREGSPDDEADPYADQQQQISDEERYGSVMFECGLQGLDLKAVKRVSSGSGQKSEIKRPPSIRTAAATIETEVTGPNGQQQHSAEVLEVSGDQATTSSQHGGPAAMAGSAPSHSSHTAFRQRSEKGTPTAEQPDTSTGGRPLSSSQQPEKDVSSCSLQIKAVWLSFAAPPRTTAANKKSAELAGILDRNLLSTTSPSINAWMNSGDRLAITVLQLLRAAETRSLSVLAGLMAEALDVQQIHLPVRSKYGCLSLMSRTLQEDPSCQLNSILHRYALMLQSDWAALEARLSPAVVPPLSTLKQGVVVLSRQWKNAIYTPLMLTFALHQQTAVTGGNVSATPAVIATSMAFPTGIRAGRNSVRLTKNYTDSEVHHEEERTILLGHHEGNNEADGSLWLSSDESSLLLSPIGGDLNRHQLDDSTVPLLLLSGNRAGATSPLSGPAVARLSALRRKFQAAMATGAGTPVPSHSGYELKTIPHSASNGMDEDVENPPPGTEDEEEVDSAAPLRKADTKEEDLYNWMARQQRETVKKSPLLAEGVQQQQQPIQQHQPNLLVDTRAIFVPLFASVGLENRRSLAETLSLSGSASVLGGIEELRVEIFESEWSQGGVGTPSSRRSKNKAGNGGGKTKNSQTGSTGMAGGTGQLPKFTVYIPPEVPAFLCERMAIEIQVKQISDGEESRSTGGQRGGAVGSGGGGGSSGEGPNVRGEPGAGFLGQLGLLKPERTTSLNFSLSVGYLAQQVNMPLLRLVHQLGSVYLNAKNTQIQLKEQRPLKRGPDPLRALAVIFDPMMESAPPSPVFAESGRRVLCQLDSSQQQQPFAVGLETSAAEDDEPLLSSHHEDLAGSPTTAVQAGHWPSSGVVPNCWRTIYHLLDLYASMTAASTVNKQHSSNLTDHHYPHHHTDVGDAELGLPRPAKHYHHTSKAGSQSVTAVTERTRLVVFGIMKIHRVRLLAMLSGLRLESEIVSLHASLTYKEKVRQTPSITGGIHAQQQQQSQAVQHIPRMECSLTGHLGRAMIVLLEGVAPSQQTVVKITVGKSQALYSRLTVSSHVPQHGTGHHSASGLHGAPTGANGGKEKNSGLLSIGAVHVDIPQHPGVLHGMMTRGSKQLSSTLQEFRVPRLQASRAGNRNTSTIPDEVDNSGSNNGISGPMPAPPSSTSSVPLQPPPPLNSPPPSKETLHPPVAPRNREALPTSASSARLGLQPLVMQFSVILQRLSVTAALLPSLQAQYQMEQVVSAGVTGSKAKFDIDLPRHSLSFTTKLQITENLPPSASIELPQVHVGAEYLQEGSVSGLKANGSGGDEFVDGVVLCRGAYLDASAEIGTFEHCLTTDLLNHLVFVQKVFMAEVNDVLTKVSGGDKPVPLWEDNYNTEAQEDPAYRMLLYNLVVRLKGIQITATTPTNTAVRLETGLVELQLSNRVQNVANNNPVGGSTSAPSFSSSHQTAGGPAFSSSGKAPPAPSSTTSSAWGRPAKLFGRAKVDLNLSLGQLIRNPLFEEAEAEFQQVAFFKTRISLRNAFQDELTPEGGGAAGETADKEVVLITLTRPLIYLQPAAVDKAILVWLNYKNAYDYWTEQRGSWVPTETLTVSDRLLDNNRLGQLTSQLGVAPGSLGTLFLQLTVDDMGICMPLSTMPGVGGGGTVAGGSRGPTASSNEPETCSAVVVTLENSSISACSSGSLVSKGKFTGLCLRFADDFETGLDDWKPDIEGDPTIMNLCVVSEGTYEVCSRTVTPATASADQNAKWILHVGWQMEGVDTHFDTSIGKQFSALGHTLTGLTGVEEEEEDDDLDEDDDDADDDHHIEEQRDEVGSGSTGSVLCGSEGDPGGDCPSTEDEAEESPSVVLAAGAVPQDDSADTVELRRRRGRTERSVTISDMAPSIAATTVTQRPFGGGRRRSRLIEKEMSEQARIIQDLRSLGASSATVEQEMRRLQELEAQASKDFRRVMLSRLKRQSVKSSSPPFASGNKDGLATGSSLSSYSGAGGSLHHSSGTRPSSLLHHTQSQRLPSHGYGHHQRSKSVVVPPVVLDWEGAETGLGSGSTDNVQRLLPPIQGSPPMSNLATPTNEPAQPHPVQLQLHHRQHRRPRTPTTAAQQQQTDRGNEHPTPAASSSSGGTSGGGSKTQASEPSVDLELDFKVFINSGKCVLHTRDNSHRSGGGTDELARRMKKDRSFSSTVLDSASKEHQQQGSPLPSRKPGAGGHHRGGDHYNMRQNASSSRLKLLAANAAQMAVDLTIFHIPGLDVKVYYESKTVHEDLLPPPPVTSSSSPASSISGKGKTSTKKGRLFAWMTLHSIPEETIISPHILEFLEQALEPIPITLPAEKASGSSSADAAGTGLFNFDDPDPAGGPSAGPVTATSSFPVDVVVYCHVQPSTFRFSCLPVSRVECLLRLPSLHLVFSSKRSDLTSGGGLSVTGCLSDFSLYVFHPYGGGKKTGGGKRDAAAALAADSASESERKDSLSVNVEFVKFNLSRSRKINPAPKADTSSLSGGSRDGSGRNGRDSAVDAAKAVVRFSTLIDIGSASFKYDMRRLPEILAFPKAWYRRAIVRHLFLGDPSHNQVKSKDGGGKEHSPVDLWAELQPDQAGLSLAAWETLVVFAVNFTRLNVHMNMGNVMGNVSWLTKDFTADGRLSIGSTGHKDMQIGVGLQGSGLDAKGGIVGGTIELSGIRTSLAIREDPGTEPDHRMAVNLKVLECRLDYMGTSVLMGRVSMLGVDLRDEWRVGNLIRPVKMPTRRSSIAASTSPTKRPAMIFIHGDLGWDQLQLMISKSTTADLIKMYLKLDEFFQQQFRSSRRIFSTIASSAVGANSIRRKSGKPAAPAPGTARASVNEPTFEPQHHRHWQGVLRRVAGLEVATLPSPLPQTGTILGGTMELHGGHISLACFHGVNFKSKSWALFSLKDPCVSFATEAQEIPGEDPKDIHVVQNLSFSLGLTGLSSSSNTPAAGIGYRVSDQQQQQHSPASMATVCRISRTQLFPPQFKTIQDWFLYAFANSRLDAMERFPSLERERERSSSAGPGALQHPVKLPDYNHTAEVIFAFPSLQLHLKSEQWQGGSLPSLTEEKPTVDCSFITDFEDHIFVTVDAEAFFFLHDLITSYVREKERVILASATQNSQRTQSPELQGKTGGAEAAGSPPASGSTPGSNPLIQTLAGNDEEKNKRRIVEQVDWRNYECKTWHLEPTVRLLSWAGKRIEPYGVEYILNKLGFSQARTTIPKWVQRGAMDPLDVILSLVLSRTIAAQRAKETTTASVMSAAAAASASQPQQQLGSGSKR